MKREHVMQCPKCQQEVGSQQSCPFCGLIFSKYQERLGRERNVGLSANQPGGTYASPIQSASGRGDATISQDIRKNGLLKLCIGTLGGVAVGFFHYWLNTQGYEFTMWGFVVFAIPFAWGLAGLLEVTTGIPFTEFSSRWDSLEGWQRGVISLIVVILCLGLLFGGLFIWGAMTM
jgi:hypothetical protein